MKISLVALFIAGIYIPSAVAQTQSQLSSSEIKLGLQKLAVVGNVLYIAAHPDDENTRLLAYLSKERKVRTAYLSITRGDGGQNLIGNEQAELLGLIRTQELLAARKVDGAEQFFTRANDFGYSKTSNETFKFWGKEQILADAVWVIRKFRPDVIINRFPEDNRAGHGHHAASAILAREAFVAAADPTRFPEQLKFVQVWQAKRILWNTYNFGGTNTTSEDQLKIDVGGYNPLLGKSYGEIAAESRSKHKSQGFGSASQRGQIFEYFSHLAGEPTKNNFFDGIDLSWNSVKGGQNIEELINNVNKNFLMDDPSKSVAALTGILTEIEKLNPSAIRTQKEKEVKNLIAACAGLWFESYAAESRYAVNDSIIVRSQAIVRSSVPVTLKSLSGIIKNSLMENGVVVNFDGSGKSNEISEPYWLTENHAVGSYKFTDQQLAGNPENQYPVKTDFTFSIAGKDISFTKPVVFKYTDPVGGEIYKPLVIAPPLTATIAEKAYVFTGNSAKTIQVQLKSFRNKTTGTLKTLIPLGWRITPDQVNFTLEKKGDEQTIEFTLSSSGNVKSGKLSITIDVSGQTYNRGLKEFSYEHIPVQTLFPVAEARLEKIDLKTDGKKVGYLAGAGDLIPESLKQIGYEVNMLSENQLLNGNLAIYDVIIAGVRAYNVNDRLKFIQPRILEYVKNGGTYLVQYNVINPLPMTNIGPYPFKISRERITDEDAEVTLIDPKMQILNYPNKITKQDFDGWIQERGIYYLTDLDSNYRPVLKMNDPGEKPNNGSLIIADYGKGRFVYTSLAFFRQLPAGVPGAYRLFVNLMAKKK